MKILFVILFFLINVVVYGQQKYALVIGNSNYTNFGTLRNPINDANEMETVLRGLGFTVDKVLNSSLTQMENATIRLKNRLTEAGNNSIGFFYYAGHGLEFGGVNYLIPADANIPDRNFLRDRAFSAQIMLDMLNDSRNALNIVVLDACRDFPAAWSRSMNRGLSVVANPPANHIIMYATGAGTVASDGTGRNGLFTTHLLNNLKQSYDVNEVFRRTMGDVARASNNEQRPALYTDFAETVYLGTRPTTNVTTQPLTQPPSGQEKIYGTWHYLSNNSQIYTISENSIVIITDHDNKWHSVIKINSFQYVENNNSTTKENYPNGYRIIGEVTTTTGNVNDNVYDRTFYISKDNLSIIRSDLSNNHVWRKR